MPSSKFERFLPLPTLIVHRCLSMTPPFYDVGFLHYSPPYLMQISSKQKYSTFKAVTTSDVLKSFLLGIDELLCGIAISNDFS